MRTCVSDVCKETSWQLTLDIEVPLFHVSRLWVEIGRQSGRAVRGDESGKCSVPPFVRAAAEFRPSERTRSRAAKAPKSRAGIPGQCAIASVKGRARRQPLI